MGNEYLNNKYLESAIARFQESKQDKNKYELMIFNLSKTPCKSRVKVRGGQAMTLDECRLEHCRLEQEYHDLQNVLADAFFILSDNLARYARFSHIDVDDAIQEGVMICFAKIDKFNPEIGRAFNYFTTCTLNHFRQLYRTAKNYNELKKKYHDFLQSRVEQSLMNAMKNRNIKSKPFPREFDQN